MKNIKLKFDLKQILPLVFRRFSLILWIALGLIVVAEGFVIKRSLDKIMIANDSSLYANVQLVRVNFNIYDKIEKRLNDNINFVPPQPIATDPFGLPPEAPAN
jgi:hypothetical protein